MLIRVASNQTGQVIVYDTTNHAEVKDEASAREDYMDQTGYEATAVAQYTFDELPVIELVRWLERGW